MNDPILSRPASRARARLAAFALAGAAGMSPLTVQGDQSIANQGGAAFRSDLNNELQALVTFSRGATTPGTTYAGQQWDDTTANVSKKRNAANSAWLVKDTLDETFVLSRGSNTILGLSDIWKTILATAGFTQTLTAAATLGDGWGVWFVNTHASAACTLDPNGAETINGAATLSVPAGAGGYISCNGASFRMVLVPSYDGTTVTTSKLIATGTGAGVVVGAAASATSLSALAANLQVDEAGGVAMSIHRNSADSAGANIVFRKTRSASSGGVTVVNASDAIGQIIWLGTDGTACIPAAQIQCIVDATPGTNDMPGALLFSTTADGANSVTERMRITSSGNVKIAGTAVRGTTEGTNKLDIFNGTAPVGTLTNGISLYSTSGELRVMDAAGNATLLSPHDHDTNEWVYDSVDINGRRLRIDMERFVRAVNERLGMDFVHEFIQQA